jgi:ABC-2 type transport system permease protein
MAVYKRGYQRYDGPTVSHWTRFMVLPRFAWSRMFQQRQVLLLMVIAMIWPLLCAIFVYLTNHAELLKGLGGAFRSFLSINGNFFLVFMNVQAVFALFLAALTGPGLIAPDLANNALPLYFSRPLRRSEYALARLATLFGLLSLVTWIPGLLLFGMQIGMADAVWLRANWRLGFGVVAGFFLWVLLISMVAMASSAYTRMRAVSGGLVLGFFFIMGGLSGMINGIFRVSWGSALSPRWATYRIWCALLNVSPQAGPGVGACVLVLLLLMLLLALVIERKLRPVEVIS